MIPSHTIKINASKCLGVHSNDIDFTAFLKQSL